MFSQTINDRLRLPPNMIWDFSHMYATTNAMVTVHYGIIIESVGHHQALGTQ
jgi:hypothetical protein